MSSFTLITPPTATVSQQEHTNARTLRLTAPKCMFDAMDTLSENGFENIIIFGGALRDTYMNAAFRDIDIWCTIADPLSGEAADKLIQQLQQNPRFSDVKLKAKLELQDEYGRVAGVGKIGIECTMDQSFVLDLNISNTALSRAYTALRGDAPINSIAMGRDGEILADPQFEDHAHRGIYRVRPDRLSEIERIRARFSKISQRHTRLVFDTSQIEDAQLQADAQKRSSRVAAGGLFGRRRHALHLVIDS